MNKTEMADRLAARTGLSAAVHAGVLEADGMLFASRFTGDTCVAVFDRTFGRVRALGVAELWSAMPSFWTPSTITASC